MFNAEQFVCVILTAYGFMEIGMTTNGVEFLWTVDGASISCVIHLTGSFKLIDW